MLPVFLFTLIGCCLFIVYGALIDYYRRAWTSIAVFTGNAPTGQTRISVLIPARNESLLIASCIESLSLQTYPKHLFEVIVIDDHSTDGTSDIVRGIHCPSLTLSCLRLSHPAQPGNMAYKKLAIETGIRASTGDLIVTTDADCLFHPGWLSTLAAFYEQKSAKFIAAPVRIGYPVNPGFLSVFQTLDFITLQGITGAAVDKRFHSMCNGANLAYEKRAFNEVDGFRDIDTIPSGDDMLLMHKIYSKYPDAVFFLKSAQAIVSTRPETSWKGFFHQRVRWASKADRYDDKRIFWVLLLVYLLNASFLILAVAACWNLWWLWLLVTGLLTKTILEFPFVYTVASFFNQQSLMRWFPLLQPFHIVYTVFIGWMGKFGSYRWKDRIINK